MNRPFLFGFLSLFSLAGALTLQAESLYDNGPPDHANGFEMTHWVNADDFTLGATASLQNVKFWNFEDSGSFEGSIVWQIYSNAGNNRPGTLLFNGTSTNLTHVATGFIFFGYPEYITTFDIAPVSLPAGTYWLALHNGPLTNDTNLGRFFWETTSNVGARDSYSGPWPRKITTFTFIDVPRIGFATTVGQIYRVDYKNSLADASWTPLSGAEMVSGTGGMVEVSDLDPKIRTLPRRFYRAVVVWLSNAIPAGSPSDCAFQLNGVVGP